MIQTDCENSEAIWHLNYTYLKQLFIDAATQYLNLLLNFSVMILLL